MNAAPSDIPSALPARLTELSAEDRQRLVDVFYWYHTIDFGDDVKSRGTVDHERFFGLYGFPSVTGRTVLDVGAADGYFSFALERLGACRVLATDVDRWQADPAVDLPRRTRARRLEKFRPRAGDEEAFQRREALARELGFDRPNPFYLARALLKSSVGLRYLSVYELPSLGEKFDVVFFGTVAAHLTDIPAAFEALFEVTRHQAVIACTDCLDFEDLRGLRWLALHLARALRLVGRLDDHLPIARDAPVACYAANEGGAIWRPSVACVREMLLSAGFQDVRVHTRFALPNLRRGTGMKHVVFHAYV